MSSKRIFITGGASGLGRALSERYARDGWRVCIGDVNEARGRETLNVLGGSAHFLRCDVTREEDLAEAARWLEQSWGGVDVVVNNAGVALAGNIDEVSLSDWQWIVDINLLGVVRGCKVFTPIFKRQKSGHFVNISSLSGIVHMPTMAAYSATKAGVVAISETLRLELEEHNIRVSVVCPTFFRTNIAESLRTGDPRLADLTRELVEKATVGADVIADKVYRGVARGDFHILPHGEGKVAWMIKRLLPYSVYLGAMRKSARRMLGHDDAATNAELRAKSQG